MPSTFPRSAARFKVHGTDLKCSQTHTVKLQLIAAVMLDTFIYYRSAMCLYCSICLLLQFILESQKCAPSRSDCQCAPSTARCSSSSLSPLWSSLSPPISSLISSCPSPPISPTPSHPRALSPTSHHGCQFAPSIACTEAPAPGSFTIECNKPFPAPPPLPALTGSVRHLLCIEFLILFSFFPVSSLVSPFLLPSPPSSSSFPLSTNVAQSLPSSGAVAYFPPWMSVCAIYCVRRSIHSWRRSRRTRRWRRRGREGQERVYCILL